MRTYSLYAENNTAVHKYLDVLINKETPVAEYSHAFYELGKSLSKIIHPDLAQRKGVLVACSNEDADWLTKGLIDDLHLDKYSLAVFWNERTTSFGNPELNIAPIIKSYFEASGHCDTLIIAKSIISTACVVKTNLTALFEKINPAKIIIAAPVMHKDAEALLKKEFRKEISDKFEFRYFAVDDELNNGEVIPGIGGSIYERIGLTNATAKNKHIPKLVKERRSLLEH